MMSPTIVQQPDSGCRLPEHILLIDGDCLLCNRLLHFVLKRDQRQQFYFAALESEIGRRLSAHHPAGRAGKSMLYIRSGRYLSHSTAVLYLLKDLGGGWQCFYLLKVIPTPWRDLVYNWVARHRQRFLGNSSTCQLPPQGRDRLLE